MHILLEMEQGFFPFPSGEKMRPQLSWMPLLRNSLSSGNRNSKIMQMGLGQEQGMYASIGLFFFFSFLHLHLQNYYLFPCLTDS